MLEVSRALNPECEHVLGDMRSVRLGRTFDAVLLHDAVSTMASKADLRRALETAFAHCAPGGAALLAPDQLRETFRQAAARAKEEFSLGRGARHAAKIEVLRRRLEAGEITADEFQQAIARLDEAA